MLVNSGILRRQDSLLSPSARAYLRVLLERYEPLRVLYDYRQSWQNIWL